MDSKKKKQIVVLEKKFQHIDLSDFQTACRFILLQQDVKDSKRRWKESGFSAKPALPKLITGGSQAVSFAKQWRDHLKENPHPTSSSTESFINWETIELSAPSACVVCAFRRSGPSQNPDETHPENRSNWLSGIT